MKLNKKTMSGVMGLVASVGALGLSGCEQRYVVKTLAASATPSAPVVISDPNTTKNADGSTTIRNPDGSLTVTTPDGTATTRYPDGTTVTKNPDGTTVATKPDGSFDTTRPDGTVVTTRPDGTTVTKNPNGTIVTTRPDGTTVTQNPDGTKVTAQPDGTVVLLKPDGTSTTTYPDGTVVSTRPDHTTVINKPDGTVITQKPDGSTSTVNPDGSTRAVESFSAASNQVKKIDFLFVIDNSGSMADNQQKLAAGFKAFANTFYRRADLDICTMIITSDRYLGKENRGYQRERSLPCTKPAGSDRWSTAQMQVHIDAMIADFQAKAFVGTRGSGSELLGKSVVSFLYGLNQWGDKTETSAKSNFFRKDAVANISFLTDENNYFFDGAATEEVKSDLPSSGGVAIPGGKVGELDKRKGMKEYLDEYFAALNPGRAPTYSTTSILELSKAATALPGISTNLDQLPTIIGRESTKGDISGPAQAYTAVYQSIGDAIVLRATTFNLAHPVTGTLQVKLRRTNGEALTLANEVDFTLHNPMVLSLNPSLLPRLQAGDRIEVSYNYLLK
ncbi:MAG: hypothetical protein H7333_07145 [Bdellovibrionales bacterium]|nr:hypothetical protein [Oligoflexia bacterium]